MSEQSNAELIAEARDFVQMGSGINVMEADRLIEELSRELEAADQRAAELAAVVEKVRELSGVGATYGADEFGTFKRILREILTAPADALAEHDAALIEGLAFSIKGEPWHNRHQASAYLHEKARQRREEKG